jgi:hypothetical protein
MRVFVPGASAPKGVGLIADLEKGSYFGTQRA